MWTLLAKAELVKVAVSSYGCYSVTLASGTKLLQTHVNTAQWKIRRTALAAEHS